MRNEPTQTRTFNYNDQGDLTSSVTPESGTASYYYNANHTLWYKHDAKGQDTVYSYDSALRVTEIQRFPAGMSGTEDACARVTNYYNTNPFNPTFSANTVNRLAATAFGSWGTSGCLTGENQHAWYQMYSYHPAGVVTSKQLAVSGGSAVTASYTYDTAGRTVTRTYPVAIGGATQSDTFTSTFDGMGRPISLTGSESPSPLTWVQNVQYDFAGRMSSLQYLVSPTSSGYTTEAKGFNANGQLTSIGWTGSASPVTGTLQYGYSAIQNNGQIAQVVDSISGETIVYQYDSLKRLTSAASVPNTGSPVAAWTQTFQYDGFGNQTAQVLNGTTTAIPVNTATNQLSSASYDSNGNMTSGVGATFTFDVANRALSAAEISGGVEYYGYAPDNRRIYKKLTSGAEEYTFFGGQGEKLGVYNLTGGTMLALRTNVWFAGKLISENSNAVFQDRVGTNRASGARFHPYGDEISSTTNDREKFATYTRDSYTGVDYADQRYYTSSYGRFNTPDPDGGSAKPSKPGSWNRFAYVSGDPVNLRDRRGLEEDDCSQDYEEDGTIDQGCCLPTAFWSGGEEDFACSAGGGTGGGGGGAGGSSPPCWQNTGNIGTTLNDIASNVLQIFQADYSPGANTLISDLQSISSVIDQSISSETAIAAAPSSTPSSLIYIGGHFDLNLNIPDIQTDLGADFGQFQNDFSWAGDGTRQKAVTGSTPNVLNYYLHSKTGTESNAADIDFHLDRWSGTNGTAPLHWIYDVAYGTYGNRPCLDPAWHQ